MLRNMVDNYKIFFATRYDKKFLAIGGKDTFYDTYKILKLYSQDEIPLKKQGLFFVLFLVRSLKIG